MTLLPKCIRNDISVGGSEVSFFGRQTHRAGGAVEGEAPGGKARPECPTSSHPELAEGFWWSIL